MALIMQVRDIPNLGKGGVIMDLSVILYGKM